MLVKSKQVPHSGLWRRQSRSGHAPERSVPTTERVPVARERRQGGPSEDRALYTCECGYAFQAPVTTSVGCPHCERTQAW
ncbi:MAG: hypothetical protein JO169_02310 [Solirubrobacterales bacterium]|nr:hypothetical protein [Solirubrobacterales bacterium]